MPEEAGYDSGPYCRHYYDPSDCEEVCAGCGHRCAVHSDLVGCNYHQGCACDGWKETNK